MSDNVEIATEYINIFILFYFIKKYVKKVCIYH